MLHCWKDKCEYMVEKYGTTSKEAIETLFNPGTCMLTDKHKGEHKFTSDRNITIKFAKEDPDAPNR